MTSNRHLSWLLLAFLLTGYWWNDLLLFFLPPRGNESQVTIQPRPETMDIEDFFFTQARNGKTELELTARQASSPDRKTELRLEEVQALFTSTGNDTTRALGDHAIYNLAAQVLTMTDNVTVSTREGYNLKTPRLRYLVAPGKMIAENTFTFTRHNLKITGSSLSYDPATSAFQATGRVFCDIL